MNTNNRQPMNDHAHLDAETLKIAAMLDRLGAADRAAAPGSLFERVEHRSLASLHGVVETSAHVSEAGAMARASAPIDLEDSVFEASRDQLVGVAPSLKLADADAVFPKQTVVVRRSLWSIGTLRAVAAALLVCGAGAAVYVGMNNTQPTKLAGNGTAAHIQPGIATDELAARVSSDLDTLFVAMEGLSSSSSDAFDNEFDPEWFDDLRSTAGSAGGAS